MRISEVAKLTGLNVSNIRFYERKGLLVPVREEDSKYRNYTEEDVCRIKQILLYRKMGISVETIYLLLSEQADVKTVVQRQKTELKSQMENLQGAMDLCSLILKEEKIDNEKLDAYLNYVHEEEKKGKQFAQAEELLEDIAEYTKTNVFYSEPYIVWLFRKPWIAKIISAGLWIVVLAVPLIHIYAYLVKAEELNLGLLVVYGVMIVIYGTGFFAFRRAEKGHFKEEEEAE